MKIARYLYVFLTLIFVTSGVAADDFYTADEIQAEVIQFLKDQAGNNKLVTMNFKTGHIDANMRLAKCSIPPSLSIASSNTMNQRALVQVRCEGAKPWRIYVPVQAMESSISVVAAISLPAGTVLTENDLDVIDQPQSGQNNSHFQTKGPLIGKVLKRAVSAGKPILSSMIDVPLLVKKGETVNIVVEKGNLQVTMSGIALQDGAFDKEIQVRNKKSNRIIEGRVASRGVVKVI